ncbi:helix-turn-helix transcriptional regulator [Promicromonospora sp. MEB111]|uniref:helix-turn-helix domain-containing protein n=1 Tax=unclassified Promicromonospora TaxID=2647929 RepID=UPI00254AE406|nr:helix-turn-helix transcriptional regulator [Promicromonospora sp. MEB111]
MDLAALIKEARQEARLTQEELGRRVGRSRASISQLEAGVRTPSFGSLREILAALGKQVRLELEPLDEDIRRQIVEHRHDPDLADRVFFAVEQIEDLVGLDLRIEGLAAAALLGAPVDAGDPQVAVANTERTTDWLADKLRHDRIRFRPAGWVGTAWPRTPQEVYDLIEVECPDGWIMVHGFFHETPIRFAPAEDVARHVLIDNGEHGPLRVQPLHEIDTTDRDAARVLRLLREQAQDARG